MLMQSSSSSLSSAAVAASFWSGKNLDPSQQPSTTTNSSSADIIIRRQQHQPHQSFGCFGGGAGDGDGCQTKNCDATASLMDKSGKPSDQKTVLAAAAAIIIIIILLVTTVAAIFVACNSSWTLANIDREEKFFGYSVIFNHRPSFITIITIILVAIATMSTIVLVDNPHDDDGGDEMKSSSSSSSSSSLATAKRASNCFHSDDCSTTTKKFTRKINMELISYQNMEHLEHDERHNLNGSGRCSQPIPVMMSQSSKNVINIINIRKILLLLILDFNKMNNNHDHDHEQLEEAASTKNPIKPTRRRRRIIIIQTPSSSLDRLFKFVIIMMTILAAIDRLDVCDAKVKIHQINVPKFIENGTMDSVSLDCQYSLDPDEDHNLVVKWFFREDPEPIYQWIVEHDLRRVPQRYQGRVNPNHQVANQTEPWQRYRALNLIRPTVEMTGRYSCHVISITSEAHDADTMIVFAKTKSINLVTRRVTRPLNITTNGSRTGSVPFHNRNTPPYYADGSSAIASKTIQSDRQHQSDHPGHHQDGGWPPSSSSSSSSAAGLSSSRLFDGGKSTMQPPQSSSRAKSNPETNRQTPSVTVTEIECTVENVYPLPELTIYQVIGDGPNTQHPRSLERARVQQNSTQLPNGSFRVTMIMQIDDEDLLNIPNGGDQNVGHPNTDHQQYQYQQPQTKYHQQNRRLPSANQKSPPPPPPSTMITKPTMFECLVAQDELKHELRKSTVFVPNIAQSWNESENNGQPANRWNNQTWILLFGWTVILHSMIAFH